MLTRTLLIVALAAMTVVSNPGNGADTVEPPIEPGVSRELARWRVARYSDVRYKLNLTLETMSPVLKGTMEIRINVGTRTPSTASGQGSEVPPIILDWRKIKGHEEKSTISNVSVNGRRADTVVRMSVASTRKTEGDSEPSIGRNSFAGGTGNADKATPLADAAAGAPASVRAPFEEHNEHLIFRDGVVIGENVINLDFTSPILTSGSAITRYVDKEDGAEYIYSLFVPSDASTAFPVFDQPDIKARFTVSAKTPGEWEFVTNEEVRAWRGKDITYFPGPEPLFGDGQGKLSKTYQTNGFTSKETKSISTYVFAFAAGPFQLFGESEHSRDLTTFRTPRTVFKTRFARDVDSKASQNVMTLYPVLEGARIYVRKSQAEKFKPHAAEVFRLNREAIKYYEEYFDYKFPFPKYDLVLIPEFPFGGMEHAGATFLRESSIIFPQEPTKNDHISRALLIFHEASHQWFGDTVTMRWFDDLWLKEGFATFTAYKAMERIMPEMMAWKVFYERVKQAAYRTDSTKGTTPIYQEIRNLSAAKSAYGAIVYSKAPAFLRQAEFYLGEDKFQTAVRAFLKKHEFGNAGWEALVGEFEVSSKLDLSGWARAWVGKRGMPLIRLSHPGINIDGSKFSEYNTQYYFTQSDVLESDTVWNQTYNALLLFNDGSSDTIRISLTENSKGGAPSGEIPFFTFRERTPGGIRTTVNGKASRRKEEPVAVLPNYQDYGYGIFLLDERSRNYVLKNIQNEKDPFLRSMMWGALWDSVREGELDPREYVEQVLKVQGASFSSSPRGESRSPNEEESTTALLLTRVETAMAYYLSDADREKLTPRFEALLLELLFNAPSSGAAITYYRAYVRNAQSDKGRTELKRILATQSIEPRKNRTNRYTGIHLRTKDRFDIITRLLILGDPEAPKLLAELEKTETGDEALRYAYAARAGIATAENKAKYWRDFTQNKEISESWIEAAFGPFNSIRHAGLTLPYLERALKELPNHKRDRKIFFVNGWLGAFIGGQRSEEALAIVNKFLADNPSLDNDLRLKIMENVDTIERAVRIRAKFGGS